MKAIIMAGGMGTRLKSVTGDTPKPMALLNGKPCMERIISLLKLNGIEDICVTLRYKPQVIKDYFGDGRAFGVKLQYREEASPLGTAGSVKNCEDFYGNRDFLVISGDCACDFDLKQLMEAHRRHAPAVTMALYSHPSPLQYGIVVTDIRGRIASFIEKPDWRRVVSDLVNTGIYIVSPKAMELVPAGSEFDFAKDLFPALMKHGMELRGIPLPGYWCDIGTPMDYYRCNLDALEGRLKLADAQSEAPIEKKHEEPTGIFVEHCCTGKARLMRVISQTLMEAGADFTDGVTLDNESGKVHIAPDDSEDKLIISAEAGSEERSRELACGIERMIASLDS